MSAHAAISTAGKFFAMPRYAPLIAPVPMTPTLTVSGIGKLVTANRGVHQVSAWSVRADRSTAFHAEPARVGNPCYVRFILFPHSQVNGRSWCGRTDEGFST